MHVVVRVRRVLVIHPWIHWAVCVGLAVAAALATHGYVARLDAERRAWGTTSEVWVTVDDVAAGQPVRAAAAEVPVAMVPPDALTAPPDGAVARQRVTTGEILVAADVATAAGPAGLAEPGTVIVGIVDPLARNVTVGATVQAAAGGVVVCDEATVVAISDDVVQLAVPERDAPIVAAAAHDGQASILIRP